MLLLMSRWIAEEALPTITYHSPGHGVYHLMYEVLWEHIPTLHPLDCIFKADQHQLMNLTHLVEAYGFWVFSKPWLNRKASERRHVYLEGQIRALHNLKPRLDELEECPDCLGISCTFMARWWLNVLKYTSAQHIIIFMDGGDESVDIERFAFSILDPLINELWYDDHMHGTLQRILVEMHE